MPRYGEAGSTRRCLPRQVTLGQGDRVFGDHGFASRSVGGDKDAVVAFQMVHGMLLEGIELERKLVTAAAGSGHGERRGRRRQGRKRRCIQYLAPYLVSQLGHQLRKLGERRLDIDPTGPRASRWRGAGSDQSRTFSRCRTDCWLHRGRRWLGQRCIGQRRLLVVQRRSRRSQRCFARLSSVRLADGGERTVPGTGRSELGSVWTLSSWTRRLFPNAYFRRGCGRCERFCLQQGHVVVQTEQGGRKRDGGWRCSAGRGHCGTISNRVICERWPLAESRPAGLALT